MNDQRKDIEDYIETGSGSSGNISPIKSKKPNYLLIAFIAIALLTTLILIKC